MSTLDTLDFKLQIDDTQFNQKIQDSMQKAKALNQSISNYLNVLSQVTTPPSNSSPLSGLAADADKAKKALERYSKSLTIAKRDSLKLRTAMKEVKKETAAAAGFMRDLADAAKEARSSMSTAAVSSSTLEGAIRKAVAEMKQLATAAKQTAQSAGQIGNALDPASQKIKEQTSLMGKLIKLGGTWLGGKKGLQLLSTLMKVSGEFEKQRVSLRAILQDSEAADRLYGRIKQLAVVSPFSFGDLATYAKNLSAFSVPIDELYDTTKMLSDISAGLGVDMDRIVLAYGQIRSASVLRGSELRQLTEAGIPIIDELRKKFIELGDTGITVGDVFDKISARLVPFSMVKEVFQDMTSEGGKFYNMQEIQSATLAGRISNLRDAYEIMFSEIGQKTDPILKGVVNLLAAMIRNYDILIPTLAMATSAYLTSTSALLNTGHGIKGTIVLLKQGVKSLVDMFKTDWIALAVAGITALTMAYINHAKKVKEYEEAHAVLAKTTLAYNLALDEEETRLESIKKALEDAEVGTKEYDEAKRQLVKNYGQYLTDVDLEKVAIKDLGGVYDTLTEAIERNARARAKKSATDNLSDLLAEQETDVREKLSKMFSGKNVKEIFSNSTFQSEMVKYVFGKKEWEEIPDSIRLMIDKAFQNERKSQDFFVTLRELRKEYLTYYDWHKEQLSLIAEQYGSEFEKLGIEYIPDFQQRVNKALENVNERVKVALEVDPQGVGEGYDDYVKRMVQAYKTLEERMKVNGSVRTDEEKKFMQDQMNYIKAILSGTDKTKGFGLNWSQLINPTKEKAASEDPAIKIAENRIKALENMRKHYNELKDMGKTDAEIRDMLTGWYGEDEIFDTMDFADAINTLRLRLEELGKEGSAASALESNIDDQIDKMKDAQRAMEKYVSTLENFLSGGTELRGEGVAFDISKITKKYQDDLEKIGAAKAKAMEELREAFVTDGNLDVSFWDSNIKQINDATAVKNANALAEAMEAIRDKAQAFVKEWTDNKGIDLSGWASMSVSQLETLKEQLGSFDMSAFSDDEIEDLQKIDGALEVFLGLVKDIVKENSDSADVESDGRGFWDKVFPDDDPKKVKEKVRAIKSVAKSIGTLGKALQQYADDVNNSKLRDTVSALSDVVDVISSVVAGAASGGVWGAIAAGVASLGSKMLQAAAQGEKLKTAIMEARVEALKLAYENALKSDSLFGTDMLDDFTRSANVAKDALKALSNVYSDLNFRSDVFKYMLTGEGDLKSLMDDGKKVESYARNEMKAYKDAMKKGYQGVEAYVIKTNDKSKFANWLGFGDQYDNLKDVVEGMGLELYDQFGNLNAKSLQEVLNTYKDLGQADREWIQQAIADSEAYSSAMEQVRSHLEQIFGDLASSIADKMIESFVQVGDAMYGLEDVMNDVGRSLTKSIVQSLLIKNVFSKFEDSLLGIANDYGNGRTSETQMMERLAGLMNEMNVELEKQGDVVNAVLEFSQSQGWLGETGSNDMRQGIQGVTEKTADLLASYINAIRADVSANRAQVSQIATDLRQMLAVMPAIPTITEHMAQIQANTFDTAVATQELLSQIRSVVTTEGGFSAIRTYGY